MPIRVMTLALVSVLFTGGAALAQQNPLVTYCQADIARLCKGVPAGDGRLLACLQNHGQQISVGCAKALQQLKKNM
ncbi:cysteine rich repeat-containing protein [Aquabacter cavernae]|uniref:cysteine rich repeat-containing protein n=1 Tax=Aquabacter cavernae TaxID=2496029 RepID=UPI000F8E25E3|nr:cysteine rich repeat-containing protein [Aquabacter cavernae]